MLVGKKGERSEVREDTVALQVSVDDGFGVQITREENHNNPRLVSNQ